jgi:hypothetical protein
MKHAMLIVLLVLGSTSLTQAQSLTIENALELTVTKVERLTTWQPPGSDPPVVATAGKEFVKLHLTARFLAGASDKVCDIRAGDYQLLDARGGKMLGMTVDYVLAPDTEWKRRCREFAVEFQESPVGADLARLRLKGAEVDISKVRGAKGGPGERTGSVWPSAKAYALTQKDFVNFPASSIQVETVLREGKLKLLLTLRENSRLPSGMPPAFILETKGSKDIDVRVNQDVGYTYFAGLYFLDSTRLSVSDDGTVQVDRQGVRARLNSGSLQTLNSQFQVLHGANLTLTASMEFELRSSTGNRIVGPALLLDYSGSPGMGLDYASVEERVGGGRRFILVPTK